VALGSPAEATALLAPHTALATPLAQTPLPPPLPSPGPLNSVHSARRAVSVIHQRQPFTATMSHRVD